MDGFIGSSVASNTTITVAAPVDFFLEYVWLWIILLLAGPIIIIASIILIVRRCRKSKPENAAPSREPEDAASEGISPKSSDAVIDITDRHQDGGESTMNIHDSTVNPFGEKGDLLPSTPTQPKSFHVSIDMSDISQLPSPDEVPIVPIPAALLPVSCDPCTESSIATTLDTDGQINTTTITIVEDPETTHLSLSRRSHPQTGSNATVGDEWQESPIKPITAPMVSPNRSQPLATVLTDLSSRPSSPVPRGRANSLSPTASRVSPGTSSHSHLSPNNSTHSHTSGSCSSDNSFCSECADASNCSECARIQAQEEGSSYTPNSSSRTNTTLSPTNFGLIGFDNSQLTPRTMLSFESGQDSPMTPS